MKVISRKKRTTCLLKIQKIEVYILFNIWVYTEKGPHFPYIISNHAYIIISSAKMYSYSQSSNPALRHQLLLDDVGKAYLNKYALVIMVKDVRDNQVCVNIFVYALDHITLLLNKQLNTTFYNNGMSNLYIHIRFYDNR